MTDFVFPDTLWELATLAQKDLRAVENMPDDYIVDMAIWHSPEYDDGKRCVVCMAGSVLAMEGILKRNEFFHLGDTFSQSSRAALAINSLRCGEIREAFEYFYSYTDKNFWDTKLPENVFICIYREDKELFHADFTKIIEILKAAGV